MYIYFRCRSDSYRFLVHGHAMIVRPYSTPEIPGFDSVFATTGKRYILLRYILVISNMFIKNILYQIKYLKNSYEG